MKKRSRKVVSKSFKNVRAWAVGAGLVAALIAVSACGSSNSSGGGSAKADINVGFWHDLSGAEASYGQQTLNGAQLAVSEINAAGGAGGHKINIKTADDTGTAQGAIQAVHNLAGSDFLIGGSTSDSCTAVAPVIGQVGTPTIITGCGTNQLDTTLKQPNMIHLAPTNYGYASALGAGVAAADPDIKTWDIFGPDVLSSQQQSSETLAQYAQTVGTSVATGAQDFFDPTATNYQPYIQSFLQKIPSGQTPDRGLYIATYGAGTVTLSEQQASFNFFKKYGVVANVGDYDNSAWSQKGAAPDVWNSYDYYYASYDNAQNTTFVNSYQAKYGSVPSAWAYQGYAAVKIMAAAVEASKSLSPADLIAALHSGLSVALPTGTATISNALNQVLSPITVWNSVGDKSAPQGVKLLKTEVIPASKVNYTGQ
jgi:branched-chain amino acid transport system substrate-binding protein